MMKIAFAVAIAAAVLTPALLLVGTIPAEAQTLRMAQGASSDRAGPPPFPTERLRCHCWHRLRRRHRWPTAKLLHGDHDSRPGRWPLSHAQRAPLRLNDTGNGNGLGFGRLLPGAPPISAK